MAGAKGARAASLDTLDANQQRGFISFFKELPEKPTTTVRFFDRSDYYTVHDQDAHLAAKDVFKSTAVIKYLGSDTNKLASVILSIRNFEFFIRHLVLVKHYRLEIFKNKASKGNDWHVEYRASPGNLIQLEPLINIPSHDVASNALMAVKFAASGQNKLIGVAVVDVTTRQLSVSEFTDGEELFNLEALVVQLGPKECVVTKAKETKEPDGTKKIANTEDARLKELFERSGVLLTEAKKSEFNATDIVQDLNRLLKAENAATLPEMDKTTAMSALSAAIKFMGLLQDEDNFDQFTLQTIDNSCFVRLDATAMKALSLMPSPEERHRDPSRSVLSLLNCCRTAAGSRLLEQWLKQPLMDRNRVEERLNIVETLVDDTELLQGLAGDYLTRIPDLHKLAKKFYRKRASLNDLYLLYQALKKMPRLVEALRQNEGNHTAVINDVFVQPLESLMDMMKPFCEMIEQTLDLERAGRGEFVIKADFDEGLLKTRGQIDEVEEEMKTTRNKVARDLRLDTAKVKLESNAQIGYYLRVTLKDETRLRNNENYIMLDTNKSGVRFHNSDMRHLNKKYLQYREDYELQMRDVVKEVGKVACDYSEPMTMLCGVLAPLDVLTAFASVAVSAGSPYTRPILHDPGHGIMKLKQVRHPCLELHENTEFIPNDIEFDANGKYFYIITGPNMGGKSTFIRSVGVAVLMAQIGSFVPCERAEISMVDAILARVGAGDCLMRGVSTFMAEMLEVSTVIKVGTPKSLIIMDELGRGTSTYDGYGLAYAISDHIAKEVKAFCMFATHFYELTSLADDIPAVGNLHVTAHTEKDKLTFLYEVKPGCCDRSFGLHVAEMAGFPPDVLEEAKKLAAELEDWNGDAATSGPLAGDGQDAVEKRRAVKKEGQQIIETYIKKLKAMPLSTMSQEEQRAAVADMKKEILAKDNLYIQYILSRHKHDT